MNLCSLGELGGLLFLAVIVGTICGALFALLFGWIAGKALDDVNRIEAAQYQQRKDDK